GWGTVKVWDARTGAAAESFELQGHAGHVNGVAFSPDGTRIVSGSGDRTVKVWDVRTGTELLELRGYAGIVTGVAFSPDGARLVARGADGSVKVWDAETGRELPGRAVPEVAPGRRTSPDGRLFVRLDEKGLRLVSLQPDDEELAYRRLHARPNLGRY